MVYALKELDKVEITCLQDNYVDVLSADGNQVLQRPVLLRRTSDNRKELTTSPLAEHGFSTHIKLGYEQDEVALLFDFGCSEQGALSNADLLSVDLASVRSLVLSHGHLDHVGGLKAFVERLAGQQLDLVLHPAAIRKNRFVKTPTGERLYFPPFDFDEIVESGVALRKSTEPLDLLDGKALFLGEIPSVCPFEEGMQSAFFNDGDVEQKDAIEDDSSLVFHLRGKGLIIVSGCAHAGIVNTIAYARDVTGVERVHAVMGGFHLGSCSAAVVEQTITALKMFAPEYVIPAHCTGREATLAIEKELPENFLLNMSGTRLCFHA